MSNSFLLILLCQFYFITFIFNIHFFFIKKALLSKYFKIKSIIKLIDKIYKICKLNFS